METYGCQGGRVVGVSCSTSSKHAETQKYLMKRYKMAKTLSFQLTTVQLRGFGFFWISCACVTLSLMSFFPILVYKLSLLFSLFKINACDTISSPTWVISQSLTFPSLKQPPAGALIDPADGLGANLPRDRQEVTVFHCSIWCNYSPNKHVLDSYWPSNDGRKVGGTFVRLHVNLSLLLFIRQAVA